MAEKSEDRVRLSYFVKGTKTGNFPVSVAKRRAGKKVTIIDNISGDLQAFLKDLKNHLSVGGSQGMKNGSIEVQGDQTDRVCKWLVKMQCLTNVKKAKLMEIENLGKQQSQKKKKATTTKGGKSKKLVIPLGGVPLTKQEIKAMKPKTLKAHLTSRGLNTQGNKKELIARLMENALETDSNQKDMNRNEEIEHATEIDESPEKTKKKEKRRRKIYGKQAQEPQSCQCRVCEKQFSSKTKLFEHLKKFPKHAMIIMSEPAI